MIIIHVLCAVLPDYLFEAAPLIFCIARNFQRRNFPLCELNFEDLLDYHCVCIIIFKAGVNTQNSKV